MFEMFYEMQHTPFTRSIPTDMLCETHQNAEILNRLEYTAKNQLFSLLVGEPGTGKTSTLRHLKDKLPEEKYMVIYISDSKLTPRSFYCYMLGLFGCKSSIHSSTSRKELIRQVEIMRSIQNKKVIVIIDESHLLNKEMLEEARFLLNYKMDSENPMALILSGQTELWDRLRLSAYRAILGRVDIECFLTPMDFSDTKRYIEAQLRYSGHTSPIFTEDAMKSIFDFSGGNPRAINRACTQSLIYGSQMKQNCIDSKSVDIVLENEVTEVNRK
jgi:type II secretory pathway predicted ATPase ExeA